MPTRRNFFTIPLATYTGHAAASDPLEFGGVVLLQPPEVFGARAPSADALSVYIKTLVSAARQFLATTGSKQARSGFVVVAIKPIRQSRVWFDFKPPLDDATRDAMASALERVMPMPVKEGPVVFALKVGAFGGAPPPGAKPLPPEWWAEIRRNSEPMHVEQIVRQIWP